MNIYHLKYFIDAARSGSISKSAQQNHVSHSAVSQAIKKLEEYFAVELMYHSKRLFQLTPQGEICLVEGQKLLNSLDAVRGSLQQSTQEVSGDFTICAPNSLIVESLYKTLALYHKKYPKVRIHIKPGSAAQVRSSFRSGESAVGILVDDGLLEDFHQIPIAQGEFVFVSKTGEEDLRDAEVIITSRDKIECVSVAKSFKSKYKKEMSIAMEVVSWGVIKNLARKGLGVGYVPDYCVNKELKYNSLHILKVPISSFKYEIKAIWPKPTQLHENARLFIEMLREANN